MISPSYSFTLSHTNCLLRARVNKPGAGLPSASLVSTALNCPVPAGLCSTAWCRACCSQPGELWEQQRLCRTSPGSCKGRRLINRKLRLSCTAAATTGYPQELLWFVTHPSSAAPLPQNMNHSSLASCLPLTLLLKFQKMNKKLKLFHWEILSHLSPQGSSDKGRAVSSGALKQQSTLCPLTCLGGAAPTPGSCHPTCFHTTGFHIIPHCWIIWRGHTSLPNNSSHAEPGWMPNPSGCHSNTEFPAMPHKGQHRLFPRPGCACAAPATPWGLSLPHRPPLEIPNRLEIASTNSQCPLSALPRAVLACAVTQPTERGSASTDQPGFPTVYPPKPQSFLREIVYTLIFCKDAKSPGGKCHKSYTIT